MKEVHLTVKCVRDNGMFEIWPAQSAVFWPAAADTPQQRPFVEFRSPDDVRCSFDRGVVYIMNASGKTIEAVDLDAINALATN